jgi:predicted Zn finger-like uncharacterized protein
MHIVCPHCTTSYAINPAALGTTGRIVRCSRCKQTWPASPEDVVEMAAAAPAMAQADRMGADDAAAEWDALAREEEARDTPVVESPSISAGWPSEEHREIDGDWARATDDDDEIATTHRQRLSRLFRLPSLPRIPLLSSAGLPAACAAMGAIILALTIWRADLVRLLPQTATFYKMVGMDVNLRGLAFKDIKVSHETVDGKPVLVIEGMIVGQTARPVELPRLRFSVRDAQGAEIYAWNAVLEQPVLKPGERAYFKSRLAAPPPEGRNIDVRFFNKRDLAGHA